MPSFTFYASAEAIPPTGATPVFCDIDPDTYCVTADTVRAALTPRTKAVIAVHLFGNVAPVARDRGARGAGARGRRPGGRLAARRPAGRARSAPRRRSRSSPPRTSAASATAALITTSDADDRRTRAHAALPRLARQGRPTSRSATTRAWTSSRRRSCACSCPTSTSSPTDAAAPGATTSEAGLGELVKLPAPVAGALARPGTSTSCAIPQVERLEAALAAAEIGYKRLLPHARPPPGADARVGRGVELPATDQAARTHLAIPMSPVPDARAGRCGDGGGAGRRPGGLRASSASARADPPRGPRARRVRAPPSRRRARGRRASPPRPPPRTPPRRPPRPGVSTAPPPTRQARRSVAPRSGELRAVTAIVSSLVVIAPGPTNTSSSTMREGRQVDAASGSRTRRRRRTSLSTHAAAPDHRARADRASARARRTGRR